MEIDPIRVVDKTQYRDRESQSKISVPKWFLAKIGDAETVDEVRQYIRDMENSEEENLCKRKSINLAEVRIRVIQYEEAKKLKKKK